MSPLRTVQTDAMKPVAFLGQRELGCCGYDELAVKPATTRPLRSSPRLRVTGLQASTPDTFPIQNLENE